jgi:hypothetical protein
MRIRLNHFLVLVQLCLLGAGAVSAQPGWMPPPTPCDTVRPFNLGWRTDTVITGGIGRKGGFRCRHAARPGFALADGLAGDGLGSSGRPLPGLWCPQRRSPGGDTCDA